MRESIALRTSLSSSKPNTLDCYSAISIPYTRQTELKISTLVKVGGSPDLPSMCFHDRTADRQPHADSAGLGSKKWLKKLIQLIGGNPPAGITNRNNDVVRSPVPRNQKNFLRL